MAINQTPRDVEGRKEREKDLLRYQEDIDGGKVEIIEVGHGRHSLTTSMHPSIELRLG